MIDSPFVFKLFSEFIFAHDLMMSVHVLVQMVPDAAIHHQYLMMLVMMMKYAVIIIVGTAVVVVDCRNFFRYDVVV